MREVKLAYIITAHTNPPQLLRLLRAIESPGIVSAVALHIDAKAAPELHLAARQYANAHRDTTIIASESIIWGSWRLAHAQIRAVRELLRASADWDYCINLTGQDYPLKTQPQIAQALAQGPDGANYLEILDFDTASPNARKRLEYWWMPWRGKMKKLWRRRRQPKFKVYWGSNYFALTRAACEKLAHSDVTPRMERAFRFTLCSDELIIQNALMHGAQELRDSFVNKTFRKLTWTGGWHPRTYTLADRDELLSSDAWFARKFDPAVDASILDAMDAHLREQASAPAG